jgi:hypothetical protein
VITKYRNKVLETQFKTAYSLISQALFKMKTENPNLNDTYCGTGFSDRSNNMFIKDFSQYFHVTKLIQYNTGSLNAFGYSQAAFYLSSSKNSAFNNDVHDNGMMFLKNGMMIASSGCWWDRNRVDFIADTNGTKGPNRFGYDVFYFQIDSDDNLVPSSGLYSFGSMTEEVNATCCNFTSSTCYGHPNNTGCSCALYALRNVYPQDSTKKYWENLP